MAQRLKLEQSPVQHTRVTSAFSPVCDCSSNVVHIDFALRRAETVTIDVVRGGRIVRGIVAADRVRRGRHTFVWNGTDANDAIAPDGVYRFRLELSGGRTITLPNTTTLDTKAPVVRALHPPSPGVFSPDRDGHADRVVVGYALDEQAHALLYAAGKVVARGHSHATTGALAWYGGLHGVPFRPGRYRILLGAVDLAGNVSQQAPAGVVWLRYVALPRHVYRVHARSRFLVRVSADAPTLRYRLHGRSVVAGRVVRLRAPAAPGRYRLLVIAGSHAASAAVVVRR